MADWRKIPEVGTVWGIRFVVFLARVLGRPIAGGFLFLVSLYYVAFRGKVRRASHDYLRRVGRPAGLAGTLRHIHTFARVSLDRLFFLTGEWSPFVVESHGHELFRGAAESGRGALLLGAHLGSFEVMRSRAEVAAVPVNVVVDFSNAERISSVLRQLAPGIDTRLLALDRDPLTAMLAVKDCIDRGEIVAILGDRVSKGERRVTVRFLGEPAHLPAGPWLLAHALNCPVFFAAGIYRAPNRYDLHCEVLAEEVVLGRGDRASALERYAQRYASVVERYVTAAPLNWFNFYDFWSRT